jgi:histidyl-tRNA synthetase
VGASIGLDRLLALLGEAGWLDRAATTAPVLLANFPGTDPAISVMLAARLRAAGIGVEVYPDAIAIGKQMGYGSSRGHKLAVIVGPDEAARQVFNLRHLASRHEEKGLAWPVLEESVAGALEPEKQGGTA